MSSTTHHLPGVDFTTLSQRRAIDHIRQARRQADAESARTIRECDLDAKVKSAVASTQSSTISPVAIAHRLPPHIYAAAALALFVLVAGLLSLSSSQRLRNSADGGVVAGSSTQWRDGVEVQVQP